MNQRTSHILYGYWNEVRGDRLAPGRFEIEPSRITNILSETFILEKADSRSYPFRLAGTRICDHFGTELRGRNFLDLIPEDDRDTVERDFADAMDQGAVAVFEIEASDPAARTVAFELIVLPLVHGARTVSRYVGAMSAINPPHWLGHQPLGVSGLLRRHIVWPDGRPHAVVERQNRQAPFVPELAKARIVRQNRRQFRILDGGRLTDRARTSD